MTTFCLVSIFVVGWLLIAILGGWLVAQCIGTMEEPDPIEDETLLKRINEEMK